MSDKWYKDGLSFSCKQCGRCCTTDPGVVWVTEAEIVQMADFIKVETSEFRKEYLRTIKKRGVSLVEKDNYDCIFFEKGKGCQIYPVRPKQCKTWPFWSSNIRTKDDWILMSSECLGARRQTDAKKYSIEEIEEIVDND